jgi:hypothetical protein
MKLGPVTLSRKPTFLTLSILCGVWAAWPFIRHLAVLDSGFLGVAGVGFFAGAKLILGSIFFAVAMIDTFALPFTHFIDTVFGTAPDERKPPLDLSQAERFIQQGMPDAATREFQRLLEYYPQSLKVWKRYLRFTETLDDEEHSEALRAQALKEFRFDREGSRELTAFLAD